MPLLSSLIKILQSFDGAANAPILPAPEKTEEKEKQKFELCKMEYEKCTLRYEDIYKAIWTQFNYYAVIAGAILTFGKDTLGLLPSGLLASLTLIFWYWATFAPMNRYGDDVAARLTEIEHYFRVNVFGKGEKDEIEKPPELTITGFEPRKGIYHFTDYGKWEAVDSQKSEAEKETEKKRAASVSRKIGIGAVFASALVTLFEVYAAPKVLFKPTANQVFLIFCALLINGFAALLLLRLFSDKKALVRDAVKAFATLLHITASLLSVCITYRLLNHLPLK